MKEVIFYYSLTGLNEKVALMLADMLKCEAVKIVEHKNRHGFFMFIKSGYDSIRRNLTEIDEIDKDLESFDKVILFTPVWAGSLPPATRTFLVKKGEKIKNLEVVSISGNGEKNSAFRNEIERVLKIPQISFLMLKTKDAERGDISKALKDHFKITWLTLFVALHL